jgi:hydrogenase/urease accessory protein HupE
MNSAAPVNVCCCRKSVAIGCLLIGGWLCNLYAHDPGLSSAIVRLETNRVHAALGFSIVDMAEIVELDRDRDGNITKEELAEAAVELKQIAPGALDVRLNEQPVQPTNIVCAFDDQQNATVDLTFPSTTFSKLVLRSKWLALLQPGHRQFLSLQNPSGEVLAERLLSANADTITVQMDSPPSETETAPGQGASAKPAPASRSESFIGFLKMGVIHIWEGYDHLLFLFGLLIVTRNFSSSVKIITCFTIAHSITLAVATLNLVRIPSSIVEPLIAASIVYVGIENLLRGDDPKGRWLLTFAFGLVHGFGFASVLRELGVGSGGSGIMVPLVSFNLGVELGQIAIAAVALPLIWKLRTRPVFVQRWVPACSMIVVLLGGYWFVQRVWL